MTYLDKPYPHKPACDLYPKLGEDFFYIRRCPSCKRLVNTGAYFPTACELKRVASPFRDDLSRGEYSISGLCQDCQDKVWGKI